MGIYWSNFNKVEVKGVKFGEFNRKGVGAAPGPFNTTGVYVGWGTDYEIGTF